METPATAKVTNSIYIESNELREVFNKINLHRSEQIIFPSIPGHLCQVIESGLTGLNATQIALQREP